MTERMKLNAVAASTLHGTAIKSSCVNMELRSSSVEQEPRIRLPPDENGDMAELCAPMTMQEKITTGEIPVLAANAGTSGNRAGQTTPRVLEKKLITAPTILNAIGTHHAGRLLPAQSASA